MKKMVISLILLGLSISNVYAADCTQHQIAEGQEALKNTSYELEYASDYVNRVGSFEEGYMRLRTINLPNGYSMLIHTGDAFIILSSDSEFAEVLGGVHKIEYFNQACDTPIKSFEMKIPHYKLFCDIDKSCEKNVWFDGTYENSASNQNRQPKEIVSVRLIIILVVLILIIVLFIAIRIKRRRDLEKGF